MMRVKVTEITKGPGPNERIVGIDTVDGVVEEVAVVDSLLLGGTALDVGFPVRRDAANALVELPRESLSGNWRVWVPLASLID